MAQRAWRGGGKMKGKRQGPNGKDRMQIGPYIDRRHYQALMKESITRKVTMNHIVREMLEKRYGEVKDA
jgi:hypothetical protein